jgi:hypothetical protein
MTVGCRMIEELQWPLFGVPESVWLKDVLWFHLNEW